MDRILATGKLPPGLLAELLPTVLPPEVLLGPRVGEDAAAIAVPGGALILATDPITLTGAGVGAHAVIVNANDVAVMGVAPRWFVATVLLPEGTTEAEVRALFAGMRSALDRVGAALVGGHTEVTAAVRQPVVSGTMLGLAEDGRFVPTGGVRPGDAMVQVGRAPVEGAAVLAVEAAGRLDGLGAAALAAARDALERPGIAVVAPALAAARLGATAMHDPTEGGLATGLWELADASGVAIELDEAAVLWFEPGLAVCRALGADPWGTLASGALLAAFTGDTAAAGVAGLARLGFEVAVIGGAAGGAGVRLRDGSSLPRFDRDEVARVLAQG